MNEPKLCCNCLHCARWQTSKGIMCHCDLTDTYLGYLRVMDEENYCKHWEKETKWDEQRKHDAELLDKVAERIKEELSEYDFWWYQEFSSNGGYVGESTHDNLIDKIIAEMKAEVSE